MSFKALEWWNLRAWASVVSASAHTGDATYNPLWASSPTPLSLSWEETSVLVSLSTAEVVDPVTTAVANTVEESSPVGRRLWTSGKEDVDKGAIWLLASLVRGAEGWWILVSKGETSSLGECPSWGSLGELWACWPRGGEPDRRLAERKSGVGVWDSASMPWADNLFSGRSGLRTGVSSLHWLSLISRRSRAESSMSVARTSSPREPGVSSRTPLGDLLLLASPTQTRGDLTRSYLGRRHCNPIGSCISRLRRGIHRLRGTILLDEVPTRSSATLGTASAFRGAAPWQFGRQGGASAESQVVDWMEWRVHLLRMHCLEFFGVWDLLEPETNRTLLEPKRTENL